MKIVLADLEQLAKLTPLFRAYREFYERPVDEAAASSFLEQRLSNGEAVVYLALDENDDAQGFVLLYPTFSSLAASRSWILHDLFVRPEARHKGVGRALMEAARVLAQESGADGLSLSTARDNHTAQALYESLGYRRDQVFLNYFLPTSADGHDSGEQPEEEP